MNDQKSPRPDMDNRPPVVPLSRTERFVKHGHLLRQGASPALVSEGYVVAKELGIRGSGRAIPPGECAITSLTAGGGWVFGATTGARAHVLAYCPLPATEIVIDMIAFEEHTSIRNSLVFVEGLGLFAGTSNPGKSGYSGVVLSISLPYASDYIQEWGGAPAKTNVLATPVEGEGIACLIAQPQRGVLVGLSDRTGTLFTVDVKDQKVRLLGRIDPLERFSPLLLAGPDGNVYGCGAAGRLMRLNWDAVPEQAAGGGADDGVHRGKLEYTGLTLPTMAGRGQYFRLGAWAMDPNSGIIYAGDEADGLLLAIDVRTLTARTLGKPTMGPHVRALTIGPDGRVWGIAGQRDRIAHLFCYDPANGGMRDLGVLVSATERRWYGYEFDAALATPDGRIYLGESDRVSHLFMYFPAPVR